MKTLSKWSVIALLVLGVALTGCSDDSTDDASTDDSVTDDSVVASDEPDDMTDDSVGGGGSGEVASDELCEATEQAPSDEAVAAFPEDLQDEAQEFVDATQAYQAAVDAGETPSEEDTPVLDPELQELLATCPSP